MIKCRVLIVDSKGSTSEEFVEVKSGNPFELWQNLIELGINKYKGDKEVPYPSTCTIPNTTRMKGYTELAYLEFYPDDRQNQQYIFFKKIKSKNGILGDMVPFILGLEEEDIKEILQMLK